MYICEILILVLNLHVNVCYIVLSNIFHLPHHVLALLPVINRFAFNVMFYISVVYIPGYKTSNVYLFV